MSNRLMPRRPDRLALVNRSGELHDLLRAKYAKGQFGDRADVVFVEKNRRGRRPISEMTLRDKVLYRALVDLISASLPAHVVDRVPNGDFKRAPASLDGARYISKTDVASYYEFVDHSLLADELEAQTGEAPAIAVLMELLHRVMGRRVGLPQVHKSSDILGDTYIDPVRRRMRRAGYQVTTYSDDFRIASPSLGEARQALEMCAREVRSLGLTLNEAKTFTYSLGNYLISLDAFAEAERQLFEENDGSLEDARLLFLTDYADETDDSESDSPMALASTEAQPVPEEDALSTTPVDVVSIDNPAQTRAAQRAWALWTGEDEEQSTTDAAIIETLLGRALPILGHSGDEAPVAHLSGLLRYEPALTPQISTYITKFAATGPAARTKLRRALNQLVDEPILSVWQKVWLAEAAGTIWPARTDQHHYSWLRSCIADPNPALAATAAASLSKLRRGDVKQLGAALDRVGDAWRSLVLWGMATTDPDEAKAASEDRMERTLVEELTP